MKSSTLIRSMLVAVAAPALAIAQDKSDPGKASDAVKNPPAEGSRSSTAVGDVKTGKDPGKASDGVREPNISKVGKPFAGSITEINKEKKTFTIKDGGESRTIHVGDTTKIQRGSDSAKWDDLKVGSRVQGSIQGEAEKSHASSVTIGD